MNREDFEYLIRMAHQGADEECGDMYDFHHNKITDIRIKYMDERNVN